MMDVKFESFLLSIIFMQPVEKVCMKCTCGNMIYFLVRRAKNFAYTYTVDIFSWYSQKQHVIWTFALQCCNHISSFDLVHLCILCQCTFDRYVGVQEYKVPSMYILSMTIVYAPFVAILEFKII